MAKIKSLSILMCTLVSLFISNITCAMERIPECQSQPVQQLKMERGDQETESNCVCNCKVIGLVEVKKNDGSDYKEVCVIDTIPAAVGCIMAAVTIFCCGCPK